MSATTHLATFLFSSLSLVRTENLRSKRLSRGPPFSIYSSTTRAFDCSYVRSSIRPPICSSADTTSNRRIRSYIHPFVARCAHCPIIFLRQSPLARFRFHGTSSLFLSRVSADVHPFKGTNPAIRGFSENAPLRYCITRE